MRASRVTSHLGPGNAENSGGVVVGNDAPEVVDGSVLWVNQNEGYEGLYYFDTSRGVWLDSAIITLVYGEGAADNNNLSGPGIDTAENYPGYNVPYEFTVVGVSMASRRFNSDGTDKDILLRERVGNSDPVDVSTFNIARFADENTDPIYFNDMNLNLHFEEVSARQLYFFAPAEGRVAYDLFVNLMLRRTVSVS